MHLNSFNRIRDRTIKTFKLNNCDFPTFYYATNHRVPIEEITTEIFKECLQLKDDHERKKVKDKGVIPATPANDTAHKKDKIENLCCAEIK